MRDGITEILDRDIPGWRAGPGTNALEEQLAGDETLGAVAVGTESRGRFPVLVALTNERVLLLGGRNVSPRIFKLSELRSAAGAAFPHTDEGVFALLEADKPFDGLAMSADEACRLAEQVRTAIGRVRPPSASAKFWEDPEFSAVGLLRRVGLLLGPRDCPISNKTWVVVTLVTTGIQVTTASQRGGGQRFFVPWQEVTKLAVEGIDQIQQRPSVGAVVAFGILGLAARKNEKRSYLTLSASDAEYVFEAHDMLPSELRGMLAPFLAPLSSDVSPDAGRTGPSDPIDQIRRLGELRDTGVLSVEEFETKKAELLRRL